MQSSLLPLKEQPVLPLKIQQIISTFKSLTLQVEFYLSILLFQQLKRACIPYLHRTGPVLPFRDYALKVNIIKWVVFGLDGQASYAGSGGWAFGYGQALQYPLHLQAQVPVEVSGVVFMDYETGLCLLRLDFYFGLYHEGRSWLICLPY